ncbi:MAG: hypothetical protein ACRDWE_13475 [Acidimicrobiales bacterium]
MDEHPVEKFDPLFRNLLSWRLVEPSPDGGWVLHPEVEERLTQLSHVRRGSDASEVVYFGHACVVCRACGLTRLRDGQYICDSCRRAADLAAVATPLPAPAEHKPKRRFRPQRVAS